MADIRTKKAASDHRLPASHRETPQPVGCSAAPHAVPLKKKTNPGAARRLPPPIRVRRRDGAFGTDSPRSQLALTSANANALARSRGKDRMRRGETRIRREARASSGGGARRRVCAKTHAAPQVGLFLSLWHPSSISESRAPRARRASDQVPINQTKTAKANKRSRMTRTKLARQAVKRTQQTVTASMNI